MSRVTRKASTHQSALAKKWPEETPHDDEVAENLMKVGGIARRPMHLK